MSSRTIRTHIAGQSAMGAVVVAQAGVTEGSLVRRILGVSPLTQGGRASYRAATAELAVGDVLRNLGPAWDVLHDLPLSASTLDNLVIGRAGVFTVRAVNHSGAEVVVAGEKLTASGNTHDDVLLALAEAAEAAAYLGAAGRSTVGVSPLLVILDPAKLVIADAPASLRAVSSGDLARFLTDLPPILSGDDVARISDLADQATTWMPSSAEGRIGTEVDPVQLHEEFALIRDGVRSALRRRLVWCLLAGAVVNGVVLVVVANLTTAIVSSL